MINKQKYCQDYAGQILCIIGLMMVTHTSFAKPDKPRIVALAPHIVEMLYSIGAGEQIIATTDYADYPEAAKNIPRLGNAMRLQIEKVIALQPDLIIAWQSGSPSDDLSRLKQLGFNVVYSQPDTFEQLADELIFFGKITGNSKQADIVAQQLLKDLRQIKSHYQDKSLITGFYQAWHRPLTTVAKGSWPQQFLDICRIKNPFSNAKNQYPHINIEQILKQKIKLIIQAKSQKNNKNDDVNWRHWSTLPAVKHQQLIKINADLAHRMTTRSLIALKELCKQTEQSRQYYNAINQEKLK